MSWWRRFPNRPKIDSTQTQQFLANEARNMAFVRTVNVDELPAGTIRELQVQGKAIAVANVGGKFYAVNNTCLHRGGPLGQGALDGKVVTCPWHGWQFDVTNGHSLKNSAVSVDCYPTEVRGTDLFVDVGT
jgi:nitrite reductase/ring-hydroxylating ferredoxin subunit